MPGEIEVLGRVRERHPDVTDDDVRAAWRNASAVRCRGFGPPDNAAAAGADSCGRMLEMVGIARADGSVVVYHAMRLTAKMAAELGLGG